MFTGCYQLITIYSLKASLIETSDRQMCSLTFNVCGKKDISIYKGFKNILSSIRTVCKER